LEFALLELVELIFPFYSLSLFLPEQYTTIPLHRLEDVVIGADNTLHTFRDKNSREIGYKGKLTKSPY